MILRLSTTLNSDIDTIWKYLQYPATLEFIADPVLKFDYSTDPPADRWKQKEYPVQLKVFSIIPFGNHIIRIEIPENNTGYYRQLRDNGYGDLIQLWDHRITLVDMDNKKVKYTDELKIKAGLLTPFVWFFARIFYAWRQYRWKVLVSNEFKQVKNEKGAVSKVTRHSERSEESR